MRLEDAPPPGWYPDPEGSSRLRFWEGTDWSDRFRARPVDSRSAVGPGPGTGTSDGAHRWPGAAGGIAGQALDTQTVVEQVRLAARAEAERAAQMLGQRARAAGREIEPLISEYTSKITRWFRIFAVIAIVLLIGWVIWQVFVQVSLADWIGDRIDDLTEDPSSGSLVRLLTGASVST